jgi:peptide/nickel transport system substrate-binding protein
MSDNLSRESSEPRAFDRRTVVKGGLAAGAASFLLPRYGMLGLAQESPESGVAGGKIRVAVIGEPPTLDEHQTTATITRTVTDPMFETLFAYDSNWTPAPSLIDTHTISDDGLVHTMVLRANVPFHNGEILTADDAIASINRWGQISGVGKRLMEATASIEKSDDLTIVWTLTVPYGTITVALANNTQACSILPKSLLDANTLDPIQDGFVGTGPYRLVERQADAYIRYERFPDYVPSPNPTDGYAGKKWAWFDEIEFIPVPDEAARVAGLQAEDYHVIQDVGNDQYEVLTGYPGVVAKILRPTNWDVIFLNWESPLTGNQALRDAIQMALGSEAMLLSGRGSEEFIRLDPGLMLKESPWWSDAGADRYNLNDPARAKEMAEAAGYAGEPLRFMTTQEYSYMYGQAIVAKQQLEEAGFVVDLQVTDWATVVTNRAKPEMWEIFITGHGAVPDPSQISYVGQMNIYPGWWSDEESLALSAELLAESDFDARYAIWEQIQANAYTQVPAIKTGDSSNCAFYSETVGGWPEQIENGVPFWNLWFAS